MVGGEEAAQWGASLALDLISTAAISGATDLVGDASYSRFFTETIESANQPDNLPFPVISAQRLTRLLAPICDGGVGRLVALAEIQGDACGGELLPMLRGCPTVGSALSALLRFMPIHAAPLHWQPRRQGEHLALCAWIEPLPGLTAAQLEQMSFLASLQIISGFGETVGNALKVDAIHRRPSQVGYEWPKSFRGIPIVSDAAEDLLLIDIQSLNEPNPNFSEARISEEQGFIDLMRDATDKQIAERFKQQVKGWIRAALPVGNCRLELLANRLNCDKRTLQRRLDKQIGQQFQGLVNESRDELIFPMLESRVFPIKVIASHAGFSNAGNFSRYFNGRFGCSPVEWQELEFDRKRR